MRLLAAAAFLALPALAQTVCQPTPIYSPCELVFEMSDAEASAHPNPYASVELRAEFRSPRHRTIMLPGFWDGRRRMVIRFAPIEVGEWDFRVTSNLQRFDGKQGQVIGIPSEALGFVKAANVHHWAWTENNKPHLWMGDTSYNLASLDRDLFQKTVDTRAAQKFNHIRAMATGSEIQTAKIFADPNLPDVTFFHNLDERVLYINKKGIAFDMILGHDRNQLSNLFPTWQQRERYIRYMVARYSAMNVTWELVQNFEDYELSREVMKELGVALKKLDPYQHPRSTHASVTSSPLLQDGWMDHVVYQTADDQVGAIEHQLYAVPFVNSDFGFEDSGAGKSQPDHVDIDTFRRRLWNSTMDGQYPGFGNTGVYGGRKVPQDPKYLESPGAKQMTIWYDFFADTRHWELEPYFDVDGGRCIALEGVEYVMYVEKPSGPVEVRMEKHGYDVVWFNPINGETVPQKNYKGEKFTGEPPDRSHDWVLYLSREGKKDSMLKSWRFESRPILMQEAEQDTQKVLFTIVEPSKEELSVSNPPKYEVKLKRETRGTRSMMYLWTGEVVADVQGFRVLGTGKQGVFQLPPNLTRKYPAVLNVRLVGMNANGKVYLLDKIYSLTH